MVHHMLFHLKERAPSLRFRGQAVRSLFQTGGKAPHRLQNDDSLFPLTSLRSGLGQNL